MQGFSTPNRRVSVRPKWPSDARRAPVRLTPVVPLRDRTRTPYQGQLIAGRLTYRDPLRCRRDLPESKATTPHDGTQPKFKRQPPLGHRGRDLVRAYEGRYIRGPARALLRPLRPRKPESNKEVREEDSE